MNFYEVLNVPANADDREIVVATKILLERSPYAAFLAAINEQGNLGILIKANLLKYRSGVIIDSEKYAGLKIGDERMLPYMFECFIQQMKKQSSRFMEDFEDFIDIYNNCFRNINANLIDIKDILLDPERRNAYDEDQASKYAKSVYEIGLHRPDKIDDMILHNTIIGINVDTLLPMIEQNYARDPNSVGTIFLLARLYAMHKQIDKIVEMITMLLDKGDFTELILSFNELNVFKKQIEAIPSFSEITNNKQEKERIENEWRERLEKEKCEAMLSIEKLDLAKDELDKMSKFAVPECNNIETKIGRIKTAFEKGDYGSIENIILDVMKDIETFKKIAMLKQQRLTDGLCLKCGIKLGFMTKILKRKNCGKCN